MVNSVAEALAHAARENAHESTNWKNYCQKFVRSCYGIGSGFASAYKQWLGMPAHARHAGGNSADAPVGAALFYKGSNPAGHIMLAAEPFPNGTPAAWSNDLVKTGDIDKVARTAPETKWKQKYLGYGTNLNGVDLPLGKPTPPPAPKPEEDPIMAMSDADRKQLVKEIADEVWSRQVSNADINMGGLVARMAGALKVLKK